MDEEGEKRTRQNRDMKCVFYDSIIDGLIMDLIIKLLSFNLTVRGVD